MNSGIYIITNILNGHEYVGSSNNIYRRWREHKSTAFNKNNIGTKFWRYPLYRAFRKYGVTKFKFEVLEFCEKEELIERETYYYKKSNHYYNQIEPMEGCNTGHEQTYETRLKISKNNARYWKNKKLPNEMIQNIIKGNSSKRKAVKMLDKETLVVIKEFKMIADASRYLGKDRNNTCSIKRCCDSPYYKRGDKGKVRRTYAYGYAWEWANATI